MRLRRRWLGLAVLIGLMGALLASTNAAFGDHSESSFVEKAGVLQLHLDPVDPAVDPAADFFKYTTNSGTETTQVIPQPANCEFRGGDAVDGPLVTLTAASGSPGLFDNGIGSRIRGARGTKCGLVDGFDESLILDLNNAGLADRWIKTAELDVEFKFEAVLAIELWHTNAQSNGNEDLLLETLVFSCRVLSDCGPDSADGDNVRLLVESTVAAEDGLFDRMVFKLHDGSVAGEPVSPSNGAFALEGGADGTPALSPTSIGGELGTTDSVFEIWRAFDGQIECDGPPAVTTDGETTGTFFRLDTEDPGVSLGCLEVPLKPYFAAVRLPTGGEPEADGSVVEFEPDAEYVAWYRGELEFVTDPVDRPELYYDRDGEGTAFDFELVPYCEVREALPDEIGSFGELVYGTDAEGNPVEGFPDVSALVGPDPEIPVHTSCIVAENHVVADRDGAGPESTVILENWTVFLIDDPFYG